jgi:hypothetical protein
MLWWNPSPINRVGERAQVRSPSAASCGGERDRLVCVVHTAGPNDARDGLGAGTN